jgi:PIN domain nuclease of toxin-antitoxin system
LAYLLDTNVIIWFAEASPQLSGRVLDLLQSGRDDLFISVVSAWEYEQKRKLKPHQLQFSFLELTASISHIKLDLAFDVHTYAQSLPPIHKDPFDRMLIAQAIHHDLDFVASDAAIHRYPVPYFW